MGERTSWRYKQGPSDYESCQGLELGPGVIFGSGRPATFYDSIYFRSNCDVGSPVFSAFQKADENFPYLEALGQDWNEFVNGSDERGHFKYSVFAILLSFTANFVITLCLAVIVFVTIKRKPHRNASHLLKLASTLAAVNLTISVTRALKTLSSTHVLYGIASARDVLNLLWSDPTFASIDFIVVLLCELCQVQIVMRIFSRAQEARLIFLIGVPLSILSQILWGIATFPQSFGLQQEQNALGSGGLTLLSPFVYLFRIALSSTYACIICFNMLMKRNIWTREHRMVLLTLITCLIVLLQTGFFVADVANIWIDDLSEIFNTTCYVGSTVIVWEWVDHLLILERKSHSQSVLGRPIYEDESQGTFFANYALKSWKNNVGSSSGAKERSYITSEEQGETTSRISEDERLGNKIQFNEPHSMRTVMAEKCQGLVDGVIYYTDQLISRSLFVKALSLYSKSTEDSEVRKATVKRRIGLDGFNDVYVYATKDVSFESEAEEREDTD
ncbi:LAMI_0C07822g1_1 [Lachancea mirantina]|uniref:pH-response regulator protein palH/RIM21 n=1 Tax=Lachancea mirantina TaxID=1230905 RepID=A0A1G4J447_9SACH|nr:LAMI_0C07822g1_1 [Lachancea mirantina]